jgi:diguanylate cyclase (GGDEF)-like protein
MQTEKTMPLLAEKPRHASLRVLYIGTAILILVLLAGTATVLLHLRKTEVRDQENQLRNLSLILAEQAERSFESVDLVVLSVAERIAAGGVADEASLDQGMAGHDVYLLLREKISGVPQLAAVTVIDRKGKLTNSSRTWPTPDINVSDRDYFRALQEDPNRKSYISQPEQNRITGAWMIFLARRVSGANGEFLGIILGAIEPRYFEDFYRAISLGSRSTMALQRLDGVMLVRFPPTDTIGKVFANSQSLMPDGISGTSRSLSPIDGQMRLKAAHRLTSYPVLALTTMTEEAAMADWRAMARLIALGALGCAIAIAIAGFAFGRQWKQQALLAGARAELQRQQDRAAAMTTAAEVAQATAAQMTYSAEHDFLTGLPNRILLNDRISHAIALAQRHGKAVAVLFMDLDGFKHINDSLGHAIGDKLLQSIAERLVACVRRSDTVSRQGGDEFVVLLSEVEETEGAAVAAGRIVQAVAGAHLIDQHELHVQVAIAAGGMLEMVAKPHPIDHHDLYVTASIGVSLYPDDGMDADTLIQNADIAMYQAKEDGRQGYQFFEPEMNARAVERQYIEECLRRALERNEFALHYQPIIDLKTGAISGAEALIRWTHPTRGMIPPVQFIPVAEDCGLMLPIGKWVLREACRQTQAWVEDGLAVGTIAVNVSALEFRSENFVESLLAILSETGLDPRLLKLELTESMLMKRPETAAFLLQTLRERGVRVAIDDFGTGYSSLAYLQTFPLDALKIDQSFVRQIGTAGADTSIVTAVIGMAQGLKLRVIAEGVETLEQLEFLRAHRCEAAQGYYFSRPVPPEQFAKLLRSGIPDQIVSRTELFEPGAA